MAEGAYYPDEGETVTADDPTETFQLISGVEIYGGFAGDETIREERDWVNNQTILSGDIGAEEDPDDNSYHVVKGASNATIDGFTIKNGYAKGSGADNYGGGIYCSGSSPTITNCTITDNKAEFGGGGGCIIMIVLL